MVGWNARKDMVGVAASTLIRTREVASTRSPTQTLGVCLASNVGERGDTEQMQFNLGVSYFTEVMPSLFYSRITERVFLFFLPSPTLAFTSAFLASSHFPCPNQCMPCSATDVWECISAL
mmetsp:Transcript_30743/g.46428  ORF Transcript_30743/g.46428 Transcript_30743/m.46428 type:complete len:120 (-) Transcript_30743:124-483(-)